MGTTSNRFFKPGATALAIAMAIGTTYEGTRLKAYYDVGHRPTICMGETHGVFMGMTKTQTQCDVMFKGAMNDRVHAVDKMLKRPESEQLRAALADFAYNEGEYRLQQSTALRLINAGHEYEGCNALLNYTRAGKQHLKGLRNRRISERNLCVLGLPK